MVLHWIIGIGVVIVTIAGLMLELHLLEKYNILPHKSSKKNVESETFLSASSCNVDWPIVFLPLLIISQNSCSVQFWQPRVLKTKGKMAVGGQPFFTEWLWYNYPEPIALHDYGFLGENFRERERIKRKQHRWTHRLRAMPALERRALLAAIREAWPETTPSITAMPPEAQS